jgi:hypothetical protein
MLDKITGQVAIGLSVVGFSYLLHVVLVRVFQ